MKGVYDDNPLITPAIGQVFGINGAGTGLSAACSIKPSPKGNAATLFKLDSPDDRFAIIDDDLQAK